MSDTIIVKNNTGTAVFIEDMGIEVPGAGQRTFSDIFDFIEICRSEDLKIYVNNSTFTINDGTDDLSISDAIDYIDCKSDAVGGDSTAHSILDHIDVEGSPFEHAFLKWDVPSQKWITSLPTAPNGPYPPDTTAVLWFNTVEYDLYYFHQIVGDWVSVATNIYTYGRSGNVDGSYLGIGGWATGGYYYIYEKAWITGVYCNALSLEPNKGFEIRINGSSVYSFNLVNYLFSDTSIALSLSPGDTLQIWCSPVAGPIRDIVCQVSVQWSYQAEGA